MLTPSTLSSYFINRSSNGKQDYFSNSSNPKPNANGYEPPMLILLTLPLIAVTPKRRVKAVAVAL